jgi:hypothetical protein
MAKHTIHRPDLNGPVKELRLHVEDCTASWERYGDGAAQVRVQAHAEMGWLSVEGYERGTKSKRETLISLSREQAYALRDFLNDTLPKSEGRA